MPAPKSGPGKPKLTPKLVADLSKHLRIGMPIVFACAEMGIHRSTYYDWLEKAADAVAVLEEGHKLTAAQLRLTEFAATVDIARNAGGAYLYQQLLAAPANGWQRYSVALERQFHEIWSTRFGAAGYTMNVDKKSGAVEVKLSFELDQDAAEQLRER